MTALWWYALIGSCVACYALGVLHTLDKEPKKLRCLSLAVAAGALWPLALLASAWIDWYERHESA